MRRFNTAPNELPLWRLHLCTRGGGLPCRVRVAQARRDTEQQLWLEVWEWEWVRIGTRIGTRIGIWIGIWMGIWIWGVVQDDGPEEGSAVMLLDCPYQDLVWNSSIHQ